MSFTNDDWFVIKDLDGFINSTRRLVFNNYGGDAKDTNSLIGQLSENEEEELDRILSYDESYIIIKSIAKTQKNKNTKEKRLIINDLQFEEIVFALNDRMTSNILNGLVNRGLVETAYDEEQDDFIFWIKEKDEKEKS
jgi:hypothetical protein